MYEGYTNIFPTPKGILISDNHCIRHAGYENIDAIPNDVLITGIPVVTDLAFWIFYTS